MGTYNIFGRFWLGGSAFYSFIGTIGTNGISFIPLVKCISLWDVIIFLWVHQAGRGCNLLVYWYDWYEWNIIHSIGNPLV